MNKNPLIDIEKYDCFLFDLYGTLIDLHTDEWAAKTWKKWLKWLDKRGIKHPSYIQFRREFFMWDKLFRQKALADGPFTSPEIDVVDIYRILFTQYGNKLTDEELKEASWEFRKASTEYIRLFKGVEEYLKMLHENGKKVYILSNAQATYTEPEIIMFCLNNMVDAYYMSSDYKCMKPDPKYFDVAIEGNNLDRKRTIMIGDSESSDIAGAVASGIDSFKIKNGNLFI